MRGRVCDLFRPSRWIVAVLFVALAAVGPSLPLAWGQEQLIFSPGQVGGIGFQFVTGTVMANAAAFRKANVRVSISASAGFVDNAVRVYRGLAQVGAITESDLFDIVNRRKPFEKPREKVGVLFPFYQFIWHVVVKKDSPIKKMSDLQGKNISVQPQGAATNKIAVALFNVLGTKYKPFYLVHSDSADSLIAGAIDALCSGAPNPAHIAMAAKHPVRVIPFTDEEAQKVSKALGYVKPFKFEFGKYYNGAETTQVLGLWTTMAASLKLSDKLAEAIVTNVYKNRVHLERAHALAKKMEPPQVLQLSVPIHPGAAKAYAKLGVKVPPEMIAKR